MARSSGGGAGPVAVGASARRPHPAGWHARLRTVRADGTPVYRYDGAAGVPPVWVILFDGDHPGADLPQDHRHAHDFHVLLYVERGGGDLRLDGAVLELRAGEAVTVPPGHVVGIGMDQPHAGRIWAVPFLPEAVPPLAALPPLASAAHPLLAAFDAVRHVTVPTARRRAWLDWLEDLDAETSDLSRPAAADAARALLTRLLVDLARTHDADPGSPAADPLVARVLEVVERRFAEPVSTASVARELGYTPGHLTTVMRERTGRTVLDWLTERRMSEARRLLVETDLPLSAIAARTGFHDAAYLTRRFRAWHGTTPVRWRRDARRTGALPGP